MSDTNDYINAYIDVAVGALHENINSILQLKTENTLTKSMVASKDATIEDLQKQLEISKKELEQNKNSLHTDLEITKNSLQNDLNNARNELEQVRNRESEELIKARESAIRWEQDYNNMKNRLNDVESIVGQFQDLKNLYKNKEKELSDLIEKTSDYDDIKRDYEQCKKQLEKLSKLDATTVSKKVINTKNTSTNTSTSIPETNDDF